MSVNMIEKRCQKIIAAYAGTGKTTLAEMYPELISDFVCMPYKYYLEPNSEYNEEGKADPNKILHDEWPYNYVRAIKCNLKNNKILLIPSDIFVLSLLRRENIKYTLCYPERNAKKVYRKRYLDRKNTVDFIEIFIDGWDNFIDSFGNDQYADHIVLKSHQFLSDVIDLNSLNCQEDN